ncbi:glycosyl hydrolase [Bifidobacterium aemilianum]|uniref:Glycosyl hydrolase n=1 Tax=Bifidobacterium aemilianum TaxID=2493120 RepID=A0A366K9X8_9BIFI|nr:glycosyl hydrolase [Bifidobacterium aemilianum]RBP98536.1 glycosyl hydrolase [Bifidobacterium aemilianum]
MVSLAASAGLDSYVDVIQGHLSSFDFLPSWVSTWHGRNIISDGPTVQAEAVLVRELYGALRDLPSFKGLTVGNECNQFLGGAHPLGMKDSSKDVDSWLQSPIGPLASQVDQDGRIIVHSEDDAVWYLPGHAFTPSHQGRIGSLSVIHAWVFNGVAQKYGPLSQEAVRHGQYSAELAKAYENHPHRPVWVQEIGAPLNVMRREEAPAFMRQSVENLMLVSDLYGITWWCSHDVSRSLADFPPLEYDLGLFDQEGKLKELGRGFADVVAVYGSRQSGPEANQGRSAFILPDDPDGIPGMREACAPGGNVFEEWMRRASSGDFPAFVSQGNAEDQVYRSERDLEEARFLPAVQFMDGQRLGSC